MPCWLATGIAQGGCFYLLIIMDTNTAKNNSDMGIVFNTPNTKEPSPEETHATSAMVSAPKDSHLSSRGGVFDVTKVFESEHGGEIGTIISDRKHRRASFSENMQAVFSEWWGNASKGIERSVEAMPKLTKEEPVLAKAETRAEIVQEAAKHSTIAPQDDHKVVLEQFHTYKSDVARITGTPTVVLKEPAKKTGIRSAWTYVVGDNEATPTTEATPEKTPVTLDMRHTIAPVVAQKIQKDIKNFVPAPVSHTPTKQNPESPLSIAPEKIASMPIPNVVPKNPVVVSHEAIAYAKPLFTKEMSALQEKSELPPLPKVTPVAEKTVPLVDDEAPTWLSARETKTETPVHEVVLAHVPTPKPVEQPPEVPKPSVTTQRSTISPIQLSTDPHTFPDAEIQNANAKRSAVQTQKVDSVSHNTPRTAVTLTTWLILGGIVALGVTLALALSIYMNVFKGEPALTYAVPSFFTTSAVVGIPLTSDRTAFTTAFTPQMQSALGEGTQIYPTLQEGEVLRPATSKEFFATLKMGLSRAFINSLDDAFMMGVVTAKKPEPFLIIRSYNFDELFAGLLAWEGTMQKDLAPIFGTPHGEATTFADAVASNKSTRILKDRAGNEILVYSFINQNTVIITTNGEALATLVSKF